MVYIGYLGLIIWLAERYQLWMDLTGVMSAWWYPGTGLKKSIILDMSGDIEYLTCYLTSPSPFLSILHQFLSHNLKHSSPSLPNLV